MVRGNNAEVLGLDSNLKTRATRKMSEAEHRNDKLMSTQEIEEYMNAAISAKFNDYSSETGEVMTSEGGDGRFMGKVFATK